MELEGRKALVTGGSRGIGRGIAIELARRGADVAINYNRSEGPALEVVAEIEKPMGIVFEPLEMGGMEVGQVLLLKAFLQVAYQELLEHQSFLAC